MSKEFITLLGGLPALALMAVGLLEPPDGERSRRASMCIANKLKKWDSIRNGNYPMLAAWQIDPECFTRAITTDRQRQGRRTFQDGGSAPRHIDGVYRALKTTFKEERIQQLKRSEIVLPAKMSCHIVYPRRQVVWAVTPEAGNRALTKILR